MRENIKRAFPISGFIRVHKWVGKVGHN